MAPPRHGRLDETKFDLGRTLKLLSTLFAGEPEAKSTKLTESQKQGLPGISARKPSLLPRAVREALRPRGDVASNIADLLKSLTRDPLSNIEGKQAMTALAFLKRYGGDLTTWKLLKFFEHQGEPALKNFTDFREFLKLDPEDIEKLLPSNELTQEYLEREMREAMRPELYGERALPKATAAKQTLGDQVYAAVKVDDNIYTAPAAYSKKSTTGGHALASQKAKGAGHKLRYGEGGNAIDGFMVGDHFMTREEFSKLSGGVSKSEDIGKIDPRRVATFRLPDGTVLPPEESHLQMVEKYGEDFLGNAQHGYIDPRTGGFSTKPVARAAAVAEGKLPPDVESFIERTKTNKPAPGVPESTVVSDEQFEKLLQQTREGGPLKTFSKFDNTDVEIARAHAANGGSTFNPRDGRNMSGKNMWAVSANPERTLTLDRAPTPEQIAKFRTDNADLLGSGDAYVGTWFDEKNGKHVLDVARLYKNKKTALMVGADADQAAIFNLKSFKEAPVTAVTDVGDRARLRADLDDLLPERGAARKQRFLDNLLPHERAQFGKLSQTDQANTLRFFSLMPTAKEGAMFAALGSSQVGWFKASAQMLREAFGKDAPRFTALLAATSPRQTVERNLLEAMEVWRDWNKAGRPAGGSEINKILEERSVMSTRRPNAVRSLSLPDEVFTDPQVLREGGLLSGPKVDPFFSNVMGELQRVTNDTWQAQIAAAKRAPELVTGNLAMTAGTRSAGPEFEKLFGTKVDPANIQEMQWSAAKAAGEHAGRGSIEGAMASADPESVRALAEQTPSFASLLAQPQYRSLLEEIGGKVPQNVLPEGLQIDPTKIDKNALRSIFQRMDAARAGRFILPAVGTVSFAEALRRRQQQ